MPLLAMGAVGAGTSLFSGITGSKAAKKAAQQLFAAGNTAAANVNDATKTGIEGVSTAAGGIAPAAADATGKVASGTQDANSLLAAVFGGQTANLAPYLQAGVTGTNQLADALKPGGDLTQKFAFDPTQIENNPDYQFQRDQGLQAIQRAASARGDPLGGGTLKSAMQYSSGLAATSMNDQYNRLLTTFQTNRNNSLQSIMAGINTGQVGTAQYNAAAGNVGSQMAQNTLQSAVYGGNIGYNAANTALGAAQYNANLGLQGATQANNFMMQGAGAKASGTIAASNVFNNSLSSAVNSLTSPFAWNAVNGGGNPFSGTNQGGPSSGSYGNGLGQLTGYQPYVPPSAGSGEGW